MRASDNMRGENWLALYVDKERKDIAVPQDSVPKIQEFLTSEDLEMLNKDAKSKGVHVRAMVIYGVSGLHKFGYYRRRIKFKTSKELIEKILELHNELAKHRVKERVTT